MPQKSLGSLRNDRPSVRSCGPTLTVRAEPSFYRRPRPATRTRRGEIGLRVGYHVPPSAGARSLDPEGWRGRYGRLPYRMP